MPELPEILTIRNDLQKEVLNKEITKVRVHDWKFKDPDSKIPRDLYGKKLLKIENVAKLLVFLLSNKKYIVIHLNMSGRLLYNTTDPFEKIRLTFSDSSFLVFSSVRKFEYFELWDKKNLDEYKKRYGKTIIDKSLSLSEFIRLLKKRNNAIKTNLLDQKLVSGIGNIYAIDSLYESGIHPYRKSKEITMNEYKKLFENLKILIREGVEHRGSTIDRYVDLYGKSGNHQNYFRIYGKRNFSCKKCGTQITFEKYQGRGTYYCSYCQPKDTNISLF